MDSLTPDQSVHENKLITEKLLGWQPCEIRGASGVVSWHTNGRILPTPSFSDWAEAGLILDRLHQRWQYPVVHAVAGEIWRCELVTNGLMGKANTGPLAIRAAALEYIRSLP